MSRPAGKPEKVSERMEPVSLNSIRQVLPDSAILGACAAVGHAFRKRQITPILTVLHLILAAIWPEASLNASWQVLWDSFAARFPGQAGRSPSTGSVAKARGRLPMELFDRLWTFLREQVERRSEPFCRWRGHRVVLADGACVSMPDEPELVKEFGVATSAHGKSKYPLARLVTLALADTMTILAYAMGRYTEGETSLIRPLLKTLKKGDLLVADRNFAGANLYAEYQRDGLEFLTRAHGGLKIARLQPVRVHGRNDWVASLKVQSAFRKIDPTLPATVLVRLIQVVVRIRGTRQVLWLATSLLDAVGYPAAEIAALYAQRWRIETLFLNVKVRLGADVLRSTTGDGVRKELASRFMAVNIVRLILLEAAVEHRVDPTRLSFVHALRAILVFAPALASEPLWKLPAIYAEMLRQIADHRVPERPDRNEPRAVRRKKDLYPTLTLTRRAWRLKVA
jgi:hypothetical protein